VTLFAAGGFLIAILPLVITPGASFTLATQRTLAGERFGAGKVIAGTATGIYCHATLAALGLSAIVMRSAELFTAIRMAGAAYLIGLGALMLWRSRTLRRDATTPSRTGHLYSQAVLANVLNPKAAGIYLSLVPQFLPAHDVGLGSVLALATIHVAAMALWLTLWTTVLARGRHLFDVQRFRKVLNQVGGAMLIGLGVRTASA